MYSEKAPAEKEVKISYQEKLNYESDANAAQIEKR
jgi:hypothetical protein